MVPTINHKHPLPTNHHTGAGKGSEGRTFWAPRNIDTIDEAMAKQYRLWRANNIAMMEATILLTVFRCMQVTEPPPPLARIAPTRPQMKSGIPGCQFPGCQHP